MAPGDADAPDAARAARRARDRELVERLRAGDERAFGELYDDWFDRVYDVAHRIVRDQEVAAEVAQDAFLSAWRNVGSLDDPASFGGWVLRIARNGALNRQQKERRTTAIDDQGLAVIEATGAAGAGPAGFAVEDRLGRAATPGAAIEDAEIVDLVWDAAEALPARDLEVLDLQLRHGLTPAEIGEALDLNRNAANQLVHRVRGRLETAVRARVLWRGGEPACEVLRDRLTQAKVAGFGAEAVRVIERHVPSCATCDEGQRLRLQPAALFASVPIMIAPMLVKQQAAAALAAAGVPMQGSVVAGASAAGAATSSTAGSAGSTGPGSGAASGPSAPDGSSSAPGEGSMGGSSGPPDPASSASNAAAAPDTAAMSGGPGDPVVPMAARRASDAARRRLMVATGAAAALLVVLVIVVVLGPGRDGSTDLLTASDTPAPTSAPSTTASSTTTPPTTQPAGLSVSSTAPPTNDAPTSTNAPTTTQPTTTTSALTVTATFAITPTSSPPWNRPPNPQQRTPTLAWSVEASGPVTVEVTGPEINRTVTTLSKELEGTYVVCPYRTDTTGSGAAFREYCTVADPKLGDTFTLTVKNPDGLVLVTKTTKLTLG